MSEIDKLASDDAIFTVDTGMTCVWGARYLQATGKRHMLGSFNHGSMANALPQAIGASAGLLRPSGNSALWRRRFVYDFRRSGNGGSVQTAD